MNILQTFYDFLGRLLGLEEMQSVTSCKLDFGASWAHRAAILIFFACLALTAVTATYYLRFQRNRYGRLSMVLMVARAGALCVLFLLLAEPILMLTIESKKRPIMWVLFDGTDSMAIADDLPEKERAALAATTGLVDERPGRQDTANPSLRPSRMDYIRAFVQRKDNNFFEELGKKFRVQAFLFDSPQSVRSLELAPSGKRGFDGKHVAEQLTTAGKVTAIGSALHDLARRHDTANVSGLIVFSDFNQNAGPPAATAAKQLGMEVNAVGVGSTEAGDVAVEVTAEPFTHKDEATTVTVVVTQKKMDGKAAHVRLTAEPVGTLSGAAGARLDIGERDITLNAATQALEFPYTPNVAGRFNLVAVVDPLPGEAVVENNRATRDITILEDYLRLMFVEYEPTWDWRFIKEVFHRDRLVGMKGFRTFLYSSDQRVRMQNELFLPTMAPPRNEFFQNDLIFLGDMPAAAPIAALSPRFCDMVKEFVGELGGGLVVLSGSRFGPQQLASTPLADMLPVVIDPNLPIRDQQPFSLRLTPRALEYKFMQLDTGTSLKELQEQWDNLGPLPWYQPVARRHPQATVLAEHPTDTCADGKEKQPLIAIRRYGRGQVIYLAFNETYRLRRGLGELYFRQFWGQVMERLALNHALGEEKRFVVRTDHRNYQLDDKVTVTVDARDAKYEALTEENIEGHKLTGQLLTPKDKSQTEETQPMTLTQVKEGRFESRFTAAIPGEHRVRVTDPVTGKPVEWTFNVVNVAIERERPNRNEVLQKTLADETGGQSLVLADADSLVKRLPDATKREKSIEVISLVNTWFCFVLVAGLLLTEWLARKWIRLP